ncbi:cyclopropane-fatty-acyl-phospholipid synthase family protein [Mesorhizobium sp. BR1-1-16]|uniref:SAM-dependent methyltransferase n=1 Tax=Mesorhizobium sp. BR1-1-16 TaxID=2876653 RepID=UPI001CCDD4BA|nr:cyclopropane-fatty-acyl-phospholipid synthase family protein [Mesorhizobium sp. BR1-1-16]MBZ9936503.1 cyclopropane-fatty-acyl-phospholipid synthase family protein [Mesorhizobium sp. BR1-1-16]
MRWLPNLLSRFVRNGRLTVIFHDGHRQSFGSGANGPDVTIRLTDAKVDREIFLNPELKSAEAYMDGRMVIEDGGTVFDLLSLFSVNRTGLAAHPVQKALRRAWRALKRRHQNNALGRAAKNASHHYDIPTAFYRLWLDEAMIYSCAYYTEPEIGLSQAQKDKLRHIAAKLKLEPGMSVAEIGSGWGALAIYLASVADVRVTAINVSPEQLAESRRLAEAAGVADRIDFREVDYRELEGQFDRVVSIGMMEHVGVGHFDTYFDKIRGLLKPGGFALIHAIGRMSPPGSTAPFIRKYIFPGGYVPALSEVFASLERTGIWCADCENLRLHYYWTIRDWRRGYEAKRTEAVAMMGERFCRMWDFYLASVELGFLNGSNFVFQLLLANERDAVPVIRDYIVDEERRLASSSAA